jgi:predicted phage terminase large subunit-like protein
MTRVTKEVIYGLMGSVLSANLGDAVATPQCHLEWWDLCCSPDKFVAISAPRGHAKSTAVTMGYGLATLLFRERKFMLLVSDTESQSALFLGAIKQQLQENETLIEMFGIKKNEKGLVQFIKETETDIIVELNDGHRFRIIAKGAEQKLRGLLWNGSRPDIILCDDMENDEAVANKERRTKMRRWFYGALLPCRSDNGIIRMVGTILHMDSLLESLMPRDGDKKTYTDGLRTYSVGRALWKAVKYKAHNPDYSKILWPEKKSAEELKALKEEYIRMGMPDVYSQEYLNVPLDETNAYFKPVDFVPLSEDDTKAKLNYYITADLAISQSQQADYSVFMVAGVDENKRIQVRDVIRQRLDGQEIVQTIIALQRIYSPEAFGIEDMQVSKSIGPFLREEMFKSNTFVNLVPLKHGGKDKIARARSIQARMRAKGVKFDKKADWYQTLEDECLRFPRDKHDDQVDCLAYLGLMLDKLIEAPTREEMDEDEYREALHEHGYDQRGRSAVTGY